MTDSALPPANIIPLVFKDGEQTLTTGAFTITAGLPGHLKPGDLILHKTSPEQMPVLREVRAPAFGYYAGNAIVPIKLPNGNASEWCLKKDDPIIILRRIG